MDINRQISYSVFSDIDTTQIRESIVDSMDNYYTAGVIYRVADMSHVSVWNCVDGNIVISIEREILDYEY
jgi:hypothetical protein